MAETRATRCTTLAAAYADSPHVAELEIKRSRFVAHLLRVDDEEGARAFVAELRRTHHDARHHCSAFVLGPDRDVQRSSDDGEPAGTAGVPMLEALTLRRTRGDVADLTDVCAVVVRWFGGIKLGAGGLVRAYSDAVSAALDGARLVSRERLRILALELDHADAARIESAIRDEGFVVHDTAYAGVVTLRLAVPDTDAELTEAYARLAAITAGGRPDAQGTAWVDRTLR
ncbi:YigZ family protein [Mariniluteicoccus flavus]